jgi:chromosome segregation protein
VRENALQQRRRAEGVLESARVELRVGRNQLTELETRVASLNHQRADLEKRTLVLRTELEQSAGSQALLATEFGRWESSQGELEIAARNHNRRVEEANSLVASARAVISDLDRERREVHQVYETAQATLRARTQLFAAMRSEYVRVQTELTTGATEEAELQRATRRHQDELASARLQVERLDRLLHEHSERLFTARSTQPMRQVSGEKVRDARRIVSGLVRQDERAQAETLNAIQRIEAIRREIAEELQLDPDELQPLDTVPPSEAEIKRLRSRAMQYADADPSVVAEAAELAERHAYLLKHVEDLRGAADALRTMMEVADTEMRAQFDVAFASVSEEFSRVFEVMLRGGRATLDQLDGGGIEVIAQLPGKRSQASAAFSGGERSLIASSLLFGVLKMRPAPFCVLDEVDAALDEGNVDRYLAALRDISTSTQAIVVTHNRATMAAADALYGLTMDSEGTSRALSLRLETQAAG